MWLDDVLVPTTAELKLFSLEHHAFFFQTHWKTWLVPVSRFLASSSITIPEDIRFISIHITSCDISGVNSPLQDYTGRGGRAKVQCQLVHKIHEAGGGFEAQIKTLTVISLSEALTGVSKGPRK